jgi:hypothetical protein
MQRRKFLASSLAAAGLAIAPQDGLRAAASTSPAESGRQYYELRHYHLRSGPQTRIVHDFFREAFIPAANRLGIHPIGVFDQMLGPRNPTVYVLIPSSSLGTLVRLDAHLRSDAQFLKAGGAFLNAPASAPAYGRLESSLMLAFHGQPHIHIPPMTAARRPRVFELRTYESPSERDHWRKIEMFHSGEFDIFRSAGFSPVFYGDTLIGQRLPQLTYMLAFGSLSERNRLWRAFDTAPAWQKLSHQKRFSFEPIVTSVTNLILSPAPYSQI